MSKIKHFLKLDHITFFLMFPTIIMMYLYPSFLWFAITMGLWIVAAAYDTWEDIIRDRKK